MALLKTISGIRGTLGGKPSINLTPVDVVECTAAFGTWIKNHNHKLKVIVGRDGRISGNMVSQLAIQTLIGMGMDVVDLGLSTTPTVEMMVTKLDAGAGIIFTASHNPKEWNALKFLNNNGEFISAKDGEEILEIIEQKNLDFVTVDQLGNYSTYDNHIQDHIASILKHPKVNIAAIKAANFHVVVDCINSTGAISIPPLLDDLGVRYTLLNDGDFGNFAHNPEPLPHHLIELSETVVKTNATLGICVDPDVDRLAFVNEDGTMFGEEYTLVAVADYLLGKSGGGNTVSNLSSTRALADVTHKHGGKYFASAVGEVNVVQAMKDHQAIIGGEGNGGIIVPDLHYGRDALIGIALFLSHLAEKNLTMSALKATYPPYEIIKDKIDIIPGVMVKDMIAILKKEFISEKLNDLDGLKIDFEEGWVHLRQSNTEQIIRIYAEAKNIKTADILIQKVKSAIA